MSELKDCPNKAMFQYAWGGKIIKGCEQHANAMVKIGRAIMFNVNLQLITTEDNCSHKDDLNKKNSTPE